MKKFEEPIIEVINFAVEDVVTDSLPNLDENLIGDNCT